MQERTFTLENCTVVVHLPGNIQDTVRKATEEFIRKVERSKNQNE